MLVTNCQRVCTPCPGCELVLCRLPTKVADLDFKTSLKKPWLPLMLYLVLPRLPLPQTIMMF